MASTWSSLSSKPVLGHADNGAIEQAMQSVALNGTAREVVAAAVQAMRH